MPDPRVQHQFCAKLAKLAAQLRQYLVVFHLSLLTIMLYNYDTHKNIHVCIDRYIDRQRYKQKSTWLVCLVCVVIVILYSVRLGVGIGLCYKLTRLGYTGYLYIKLSFDVGVLLRPLTKLQ